ncbi:MAG: ATP-binding protein [Candidatus Micrarchaeota archaeon]
MAISPFRLTPPPAYFVGREAEKKEFERLIEKTIGGNQRCMAVIGDRGIGKSALLDEFSSIARKKDRVVVVRLALHDGVKTLGYLSMAILDAMQKQLRLLSLKESAKNKLLDALRGIEVKYQGLELSLKKPEATASPELNLSDDLLELWKQLKEAGVPALILEIDEAERLEQIDGALSFLRNTFSELQAKQCNYAVVLSGKMGVYRKIQELHSPIGRYFPPTELKPLSLQETETFLRELMEKRCKISVSKDAVAALHVLSDGNPFAVNAMCDVLYDRANEANKAIDAAFIELFQQELVARAGGGLFEKRFSLLSDVEKEVLNTIVKASSKEWPEGKAAIPEFTNSEVAELTGKSAPYAGAYLDRLIEKECLVKKSRNKYSIPYVLFGYYVLLASGRWPSGAG